MSDTRKAQPLQLKVRRAFGAFTLDCELALELGASSVCSAPPAAARAACCASSPGWTGRRVTS